MQALRQPSILIFILAVSFQTRAQYLSWEEECPISGTCVSKTDPTTEQPPVNPSKPGGETVLEKPTPTPSNNTPDSLKTAVTQCLDAARVAQSSCDNATSNVKSKKNDLATAANSLTGSTGQNCKMLADKAQSLRDDMGDWKSSCDQRVTDCNNACPQSLSQQLAKYDDGGYYQSKLANVCGSSKSKASDIGRMLSDAAGTYLSLNQCLNDITGANAAAAQQPLQPLGNFMPQQANMQNQICALNPQACGSAGSTASPYTTPAAQPAGSNDDSAPANTDLDLGSDRASVGPDDPNRRRDYPQPVDPSTLANGGQPVNPGAGFNQLPPPTKRNGGGSSAPMGSPTEVYRGYYSNNAEASFRPGGGPSVNPQADLRKDLRPQVGAKIGAPSPSAVRQLLKAQMQTELNRKLAGYDRIDGIVGPDGLTGPHSQLWYKVRLRYKNIEPYLTP